MGVLKGSRISAKTLLSLTQSEYLAKNSKVSPAFASEPEREKVYQAFERYERLKKQRNQIDELDRVGALLKVLKENQTLAVQIRQCFEEIYVDGKLWTLFSVFHLALTQPQKFKTCAVWTLCCSSVA